MPGSSSNGDGWMTSRSAPLGEVSDRSRTHPEVGAAALRPPPPRKILVVDDNPIAQRLLQLTIELEGATVAQAWSLSEARQRLGQLFDGVVLDRQLPDGDGLDLLPELAKEQPRAAIVVCSNLNAAPKRWIVRHVPKTDMEGVLRALGLDQEDAPGDQPEARDRSAMEETVEEWIAALGRRPPSSVFTALVDQLAPPHHQAALGDDEAELPPPGSNEGRQEAENTVRQLINLREPLAGAVARQVNRTTRAEVLVGVHRELDSRILEEVKTGQEGATT